MTPKQARFVKEYLIDLNATQAAIRAGYSEHTAQQQGSRLLLNAVIGRAIAGAQGLRAGRLEITAEKVLRDLEEQRLAAKEDGQHSAAIRASELQGKHVGMFGERLTVTDERSVLRSPETSATPDAWQTSHKPH